MTEKLVSECDDKTAYKVNKRCYETGLSPGEVARRYTDFAKKYDETLSSNRYIGPDIAANEVALRTLENRRPYIKIIDVAAGTGRVGALLKQKGFRALSAWTVVVLGTTKLPDCLVSLTITSPYTLSRHNNHLGRHIDALEPSKGMLDILKKTGVYSKTYQEFLGLGKNSIPD
ncbi:hypothetical protein SK128_007097, partial [Halocaridina rubra]